MATGLHVGGDVLTLRTKTRELSVLAYSEHDDAKTRLNSILDTLNSLDFSVKFIDQNDGEKVIVHCCRVVPLSAELLVTKVCQLIVNVTFRQQITLSPGTYQTAMAYLIRSVQTAHNWLMVDLLRAMGSLLYQNGDQSSKFNKTLLGDERLLLTLATSDDEDVKRAALQCMENMCMRGLNGTIMAESYILVCCDTLLHTLYENRPPTMTDIGYCRILIACFRGLSNAYSNQKNLLPERLGEILGAVRTFMHYAGEPVVPVPLFATLVSQQTAQSSQKETATKTSPDDGKNKKKKKKKSAKAERKEAGDEIPETKLPDAEVEDMTPQTRTPVDPSLVGLVPSWRSSESETSDAEGGAASKLRSYQAKTRISALNCLMAVIKSSERRFMFSYWPHFLPDTASKVASHNLFTCALKDRNHKCRLTALTALSHLLEGSKQFLSAADDNDQTRTAFTPYSTVLASMVKQMHVTLLHGLISEQMPLSITQIIKCLGVLVENTSYQKLKPGLLTRLVKQIRPFLSHRDTNIRVACLTCMGAVLSVQAPLIEVSYILQPDSSRTELFVDLPSPSGLSPSCHTPYRSSSGFMTPTSALPSVNWLLAKCVQSVNISLISPDTERQYEPLPLRLESLQVLTHLVQGYFTCVKDDFALLERVVICCLEETDYPIQLHGAKLLEALGNVISPHASAAVPQPSPLVSAESGAKFWTAILSGPLSSLLHGSTSNIVRATGCDCLSTIGASVFALLAVHLRVLCMTVLLGFTSDTDHVARSSAIRTLGVYVMYPCLRDDVSFVADVANAVLVLLEDSSIIVRIKAAWSLGNVSDAMCANKDSQDEDFLSDFSDLLLLKMLQGALKSCKDNDKIRIHAVRALGNILRYMHSRPLEKPAINDLVSQSMSTLVKSVGTGAMKVRWNACYALGNVLKNEMLPIGRADWSPAVFTSLGIAVRDCKNFKVRINAALALGQITSRRQVQCHVDQMEMIWSSLIQSLHTMDSITDFADFKLRERLPDQICTTLIHLFCLLELNDLSSINKSVSANSVLLVDNMTKYWYHSKEEPQRIVNVEKSLEHLKQLQSTCSDEYGLVTVQNLMSIFSIPAAEPPVDETSDETAGLSWQMTSAMSTFKDTYD